MEHPSLSRRGPILAAIVGIAVAGAVVGCQAGGPQEQHDHSGLPSSSTPVSCGGVRALKSSGSTAQYDAMGRFAATFERTCGQDLDYTANGSGAGISEFLGKVTDFAGSDVPLNTGEYARAQQRCGSPAWNLPVVFSPIAITYHVDGVDRLVLDAATTAKIFNGAITRWNDGAIKKLNGHASLPDAPINVVFRSDPSGTTDNFQRYLDATSGGAWGKGTGRDYHGGVGAGARGEAGTATAVKSTGGSIAYNNWSSAIAQNLDMAQIVTSVSPQPVAITAETVGKAIAGVTQVGQGNDLVLDTNSIYWPAQPGAYPIVLVTYEIVCSKYPKPEIGMAVKAFLETAIGPGQGDLDRHGYAPLPEMFKARLSTAVNDIA